MFLASVQRSGSCRWRFCAVRLDLLPELFMRNALSCLNLTFGCLQNILKFGRVSQCQSLNFVFIVKRKQYGYRFAFERHDSALAFR